MLFASSTSAQSEATRCEVCVNDDDTYQLTAAAVKRCLAAESKAAKVDKAEEAAATAAQEATLERGKLEQCATQGARDRVAADMRLQDNAVLQARVEELEDRWWQFGAAGVLVGVVVALAVSAAIK